MPVIQSEIVDECDDSQEDEKESDIMAVEDLEVATYDDVEDEIYYKVKEDSNQQDRSLDTNQSARSGSTFSLPGVR